MKNPLKLALCIVVLAVFSGCFQVEEKNRHKVSTFLGKSIWPLPSATFSKTANKKVDEITFRRSLTKSGDRIYTEDGSKNLYYVYARKDDFYIVEMYEYEKELSYFSFVRIYEGGVIASYDQVCDDLSPSQKEALFGSENAIRCQMTNILQLIPILNLALASNNEIKSVLKPVKAVEDNF